MSTHLHISAPATIELAQPEAAQWFAVHSRARHEKRVAKQLELRGVTTFVPLVSRLQQWSDRRQLVEFPLFTCYLFVQIAPLPAQRLAVLTTPGVLGLVSTNGQATPIPEPQIEAVRQLLLQKLPITTHGLIKIGQRVRIRSGALRGVEGILTGSKGDRQLVISIAAIDRSLSVSIEGYDLEPL